jgi:hypothetical protein
MSEPDEEPMPTAPQVVELLGDEEEFDVPGLCVPFGA